jgi:hypothetical protein
MSQGKKKKKNGNKGKNIENWGIKKKEKKLNGKEEQKRKKKVGKSDKFEDAEWFDGGIMEREKEKAREKREKTGKREESGRERSNFGVILDNGPPQSSRLSLLGLLRTWQ